MEHEGLLRSLWLGEPGTRHRKVYAITEDGRARLHAELEQWESFSLSMDRLLGTSNAGS